MVSGLFNEASSDDLMLLDAMATSGVNKLARETGLGLEVKKSTSWLLLNMKKSTSWLLLEVKKSTSRLLLEVKKSTS